MPSKLLIVDDEPDVEVLMKQRFRKQIREKRFTLFFAENGIEALKILAAEKDIRLVISDINMPEMDGLTLLKNISEQFPDVIPIIVSAYGDMDNIRAAMNLGAFDFVTKPINFDDLNVTIDKTIGHIGKLMESEQDKLRLKGILHELNVASEIQQSILPKKFINDPSLSLYAKMTAAKQIGGDFYDFFWLDDTHLGFLIADVSGKGVPAALFMTVSRTLIRTHAFNDESPGQALASANEMLEKDNTGMMFVTAFYAVLDITTGKMKYANGGHNPPYLVRPGKNAEIIPTTGNPALGVVNLDEFINKEIQLEPNDLVFLYTDGVTEATNMNEEYYSDQKLADDLTEYRDLAVDELITTLGSDIKKFAADCPQSDDITMLAIRYLGDGSNSGKDS
jgi:sigma-B regulation protein RsbU (phosphoserine phosphatase)